MADSLAISCVEMTKREILAQYGPAALDASLQKKRADDTLTLAFVSGNY